MPVCASGIVYIHMRLCACVLVCVSECVCAHAHLWCINVLVDLRVGVFHRLVWILKCAGVCVCMCVHGMYAVDSQPYIRNDVSMHVRTYTRMRVCTYI